MPSRGAAASALFRSKGAGKAGPRLRPVAPVREKVHGAGTTGTAGTTRPSLRDGFHAYSALSPVSGSLATVVVGIITRELDASLGAPGPQSFTSASASFVRTPKDMLRALAATASPPHVS